MYLTQTISPIVSGHSDIICPIVSVHIGICPIVSGHSDIISPIVSDHIVICHIGYGHNDIICPIVSGHRAIICHIVSGHSDIISPIVSGHSDIILSLLIILCLSVLYRFVSNTWTLPIHGNGRSWISVFTHVILLTVVFLPLLNIIMAFHLQL